MPVLVVNYFRDRSVRKASENVAVWVAEVDVFAGADDDASDGDSFVRCELSTVIREEEGNRGQAAKREEELGWNLGLFKSACRTS